MAVSNEEEVGRMIGLLEVGLATAEYMLDYHNTRSSKHFGYAFLAGIEAPRYKRERARCEYLLKFWYNERDKLNEGHVDP